MTNREKAKELFQSYFYTDKDANSICLDALKMAEWKDQQFKEYLEERRNRIAEKDTKDYEGWELYYMADITEIINDLFPEIEELDNSDRDE